MSDSDHHGASPAYDEERIATVLSDLGLRPVDLWVRYLSRGGTFGYERILGYVNGTLQLPVPEVRLLAGALDDELP